MYIIIMCDWASKKGPSGIKFNYIILTSLHYKYVTYNHCFEICTIDTYFI